MSTTVTIPKSNVPIGRLTIDGVDYDVPQHPEFVRFFFDLARRAGGTTAQTNTELADYIASLDSEAQMPRSDPLSERAMAFVEEIRSELLSLRSDCDGLRNQMAERDAEIAGLRAVLDLRARVEQLEDRNT